MESESDSDDAVAPDSPTYRPPSPPQHPKRVPLAVLAPEDENDAEEVYRYVSYFDNKTTTVYFNIEGTSNKTTLFNMEGHDFSICGELTGDDGLFTFTVPPEHRYVTREICNGELCELETPRVLNEQMSEITLNDREVYWHISAEMRAEAINI